MESNNNPNYYYHTNFNRKLHASKNTRKTLILKLFCHFNMLKYLSNFLSSFNNII